MPTWETARGGRALDPDKQIEIGLNGRSGYYAGELDITHAVNELRDLSENREDLVGQALGNIIGGFVANPGTANPWHLIGAGLLAQLKFDTAAFEAAFEQTEPPRDVRRVDSLEGSLSWHVPRSTRPSCVSALFVL